MLLATANNQGELSPLEIGMHALHCVALEKGGRGKKGGLREYAERLGKDRTTINQYKSAAEVAENVLLEQHVLLDKAKHLYAISALPEPCWQAAAEHVASSGLSGMHIASAGNVHKPDARVKLSEAAQEALFELVESGVPQTQAAVGG